MAKEYEAVRLPSYNLKKKEIIMNGTRKLKRVDRLVQKPKTPIEIVVKKQQQKEQKRTRKLLEASVVVST